MLEKARKLLDAASGILGASEILSKNKELATMLSGLREEMKEMERELRESYEAFAALCAAARVSVNGPSVEFGDGSGGVRDGWLASRIMSISKRCKDAGIEVLGPEEIDIE